MKPVKILIFIRFFWLLTIPVSVAHEFQDGLQAGQAGSETLPPPLENTETQAILNQTAPLDAGLDESALSHPSANHAIENAKNAHGKALNHQLHQFSEHINQNAKRVEADGINAAAVKPEETLQKALTPNQIINQNLLQLETFPNIRNPATEPAFEVIEREPTDEPPFNRPQDFAVSLQERYVLDTEDTPHTEPYEMGCSTTLLGTIFQCVKNLEIAVGPQPWIDLDKTITATFRGRAYNLISFQINFNTGTITGGGKDNYFHLSDRLNHEFGASTQVTKLRQQSYHEDPEWVRHTLNTSPSYANGFSASYTAFQPKTGHRHRHNRSTIRGGSLTYRFTERKRNPPRIVSEAWEGNCQALEDLTVLGECRILEERCLEGPAARRFGEAPFLTLERPCWRKSLTYQCNVPQGNNDCDAIPKDCQKTHSEFIDFLSQHAVEIHHFKCQKISVDSQKTLRSLGRQFVPTGEYPHNRDIGEAISALNIAKEITSGFKGETQGIASRFFSGQAMECTSKPKNCCSNAKGFWRRMTGCRETEQQLALNMTSGRCHEVGTYRVKNSVLQKIGHVDKKGYCCFPSKLARIIQEGARRQLPIGWGLPESPNCRALTLLEIQRIQWSLIDFSEIAKDFIEKAKHHTVGAHTITAIENQLRTTLEKSASELKAHYPNTPLGEKQRQEAQRLQETIQSEDNKRRLKGAAQ